MCQGSLNRKKIVTVTHESFDQNNSIASICASDELYELYHNDSIPKHDNFFIYDHYDNRCGIFNNPPSIDVESASFIVLDDESELDNELLFIIALDNSSIYNYFEINFESVIINTTSLTIQSTLTNSEPNQDPKNEALSPNQYFITRGQYVIYEFLIKNKVSYSSYLSGADNNETFIEIQEKEPAPIPNASYTVFHPNKKIFFFVTKFISNVGGFYGAVSGVFALLFGASKLSQWGICQKYVYCWSYRQSFKRHLASRYVSCAGIPLAEVPRELPNIEDRVAVLEHLLKEYYIDAHYLEKLKDTREKYLDLRNKNQRIVKMMGKQAKSDSILRFYD
ncbi:hypothetical protein RclHR1_05360009 [Rhizophagus clarus]|uniref:Uncharacterized protein n=1 Tax=Rhizophagus clarus TaxID=94130 RepID=A0A2Z6SFB0_9GLOM|nr:hypothetical protein RclHR1_05360009 [Rhizophagus clarus]GES74963.1 hypothetical protein GLOIN_2v1841879 [Rhizophagus clarus]